MANQVFADLEVRHPIDGYPVAPVAVRVSYNDDPKAHGGNYVQTATVVITSGVASLQFYAPAHSLRRLAEALTRAADAVDASVAAANRAAEPAL